MPGLLMQARREHGVDLRRAYLVGDFPTDVEAAHAAGCTAILVRTGRGDEALRTVSPELRQRCPIARDLSEAVGIIEELEGHRHSLESGQD
jgi:D-glycero-D-manno-heptose 1,7-bisphosphate phosphatase